MNARQQALYSWYEKDGYFCVVCVPFLSMDLPGVTQTRWLYVADHQAAEVWPRQLFPFRVRVGTSSSSDGEQSHYTGVIMWATGRDELTMDFPLALHWVSQWAGAGFLSVSLGGKERLARDSGTRGGLGCSEEEEAKKQEEKRNKEKEEEETKEGKTKIEEKKKEGKKKKMEEKEEEKMEQKKKEEAGRMKKERKRNNEEEEEEEEKNKE